MKMSKSLGNVVDPFSLIDTYGNNSVRSYFLSEGPLIKDSNFEFEALTEHHNNVICDAYSKLSIIIMYSKHVIQNHRRQNSKGKDLNSTNRCAYVWRG